MSSSTRLAVVALALVVLGAPTVSAEGFLQAGYDAARTGAVPDQGPTEYEIALSTELPGIRVWKASPLILDGSVYVLTESYEAAPFASAPREDKTTNGVVKVDPDTGAVNPIIELDQPPSAFASDGERFYIAESDRIAAYNLDGSGPSWSWPYPAPIPHVGHRITCVQPAIREGSLFVACTQEPDDGALVGEPSHIEERATPAETMFAARLPLDGTDAAPRPAWLWQPFTEPRTQSSQIRGDNGACVILGETGMRAMGLTVAGDQIILTMSQEPHYGQGDELGTQFFLVSIGTADASTAWVYCMRHTGFQYAAYMAGDGLTDLTPAVTGNAEFTYVLHDQLYVLHTGEGDVQAMVPLRANSGGVRTLGEENPQTGLALSEEQLWAQAFRNTYLFDISSSTPEIVQDATHDDGRWGSFQPLLAGGTIYILAAERLTAFDASSLNQGWDHRFGPATLVDENSPDPLPWRRYMHPSTALGDGLLALAHGDAQLTVFGRTALSIQPILDVSHRWPAPGEEVTVDLGSTDPGPGGGTLEYLAEWGDGTVTDWQASPALSHTYTSPGDHIARFHVREATDSDTPPRRSVGLATFDVGGSPPQDESLVQTAFAPENQDTTWGVIGVLIAVIGGLIAVARRRAKRSRLQREMKAIEHLAEQAANPAELEAAVQERRAHVRGLAVDGKLDEGQSSVLERRLDEVQRASRMGEIEPLLDQLPHGLVRHLREALADGQVTAFERDSLLSLVEQDGLVPERVKQGVRKRIEAWYGRDTLGSG